jgi:hypothetical protein
MEMELFMSACRHVRALPASPYVCGHTQAPERASHRHQGFQPQHPKPPHPKQATSWHGAAPDMRQGSPQTCTTAPCVSQPSASSIPSAAPSASMVCVTSGGGWRRRSAVMRMLCRRSRAAKSKLPPDSAVSSERTSVVPPAYHISNITVAGLSPAAGRCAAACGGSSASIPQNALVRLHDTA